MLSSKRVSVTLHELETHWSITDLQAAHMTLEVWADFEAERERMSKQEQSKYGEHQW